MRYSFSGHESFYCKSLWLKKGYDLLKGGNTFLDDDAVVKLGVGKNMVASIRFWMKAFGLTNKDKPTMLADLLFNSEGGYDCFLEDTNTLWLLHYSLVHTNIASLYNLFFTDFQLEKREFDNDSLNTYIRRKCSVPEQKNVYNENTVKKDINVLLKNYIGPNSLNSMEDFSAILINLNIIRRLDENGKAYAFNEISPSVISHDIILYAILDYKGKDDTISFDEIQELALTFCMSVPAFIHVVRELEKTHIDIFRYSENSGIRNIQFVGDNWSKYEPLKNYYLSK